jgi:hypothetical protein
MRTAADDEFFAEERSRHERAYLANPRRQSGFGRDAHDWERFRCVGAAPIETDASFLDIGCANGLLMESIVNGHGHVVDPYGLEIPRSWQTWRDDDCPNGTTSSSGMLLSGIHRRHST